MLLFYKQKSKYFNQKNKQITKLGCQGYLQFATKYRLNNDINCML